MKIVLLLISVIFITSCHQLSPETREAYAVMRNFAQQQKKENRLELSGMGLSIPSSTINSLSLDLVSHQKLTINQARHLYITTSLKFLKTINNSIKLRPYLHHYPFTMQDVEYGISFCDNSSIFFLPPYVAYVTANKGNIHYSSFDPSTQRLHSDEYRESYHGCLKNGSY